MRLNMIKSMGDRSIRSYFKYVYAKIVFAGECSNFRDMDMEMKLKIEQIKSAIKKRWVKPKQKCLATWLEKGYVNDPLVTFIIQSHNKSTQVKHVVDKLRTYSKAEIIVIDDGSDFSHHVSLMKYLDRGNEFLLRANDLYENVMYDKTIRLANGRYLALLQDDDDFNDLSWVDEAVAYFQRYPGLAILGGRDLLDFAIDKENHRFDILIQEPEAEEKFRFVAHVNRAPMWINKKLFLDRLAHIDFDFAPFQFDDVELCVRAWLTGCQVAWYHTEFHSLSAGGMRIWNNAFAQEQCKRNSQKLYLLYKEREEVIHQSISNQKY